MQLVFKYTRFIILIMLIFYLFSFVSCDSRKINKYKYIEGFSFYMKSTFNVDVDSQKDVILCYTC